MKISTKLKLSVYVPILLGVVVVIILIYAYFSMAVTFNNGSIVRQIRTDLNEMNEYAVSYILNHNNDDKDRYLLSYNKAKSLIQSSKFKNSDEKQILKNIDEGLEVLKGMFLEMVSSYEHTPDTNGDSFKINEQQLEKELLVKTFEIDSSASVLRSLVDEDLKNSQAKIILMLILSMFFIAIPATMAIRLVRKRIVSSLSILNEGTKIVGAGDLNFKIRQMPDDEIGELALAFNHMTDNLKLVTITKEALEEEVEERKKAEKSLRVSKEEWERTFDSVPDMIAIIDKNHRIVRANKAMAKRLKSTTSKCIGLNCYNCVHGLSGPPGFCPHSLTLKDGMGHVAEIHEALLDGDFLVSTTPLYNENGEIIASVHVARDITEQKKKENELNKVQLAVENASDGIVITDLEGTIIYANKVVASLIGYHQNEIIGKTPSLWGGLMQKEFYAKLWKTISVDKVPSLGEVKNRKKDGTEFPAEIHISPVIDEKNNKPSFYVGIMRDLTFQRKADQSKTEFISLTAHQLRTPLTTIRLTSELLLREVAGEISEEGRKHLININEDIQYMTKLIREFLDVSRLELGIFEIRPEKIDPIQVTEKILKEFLSEIKKKKISLTTKNGKNIRNVNIDKHILSIGLENIVSNAVKYTPDHGLITVEILKQKNDLLFKVSDSGFGIPKADQSMLFTKLYRASNARDSGLDGIGLGLYLSKNLIESSGGKFYFTSEENKGSSFYISIPLSGMVEKTIKIADF